MSETTYETIFQVTGENKPIEGEQINNKVESISGDDLPSCDVLINSKQIKMKFDSCSQLTIVSKEIYSKNFNGMELNSLDIAPKGYSGQPIEMLGYFDARMEVKERVITGKVYVSAKGDNLMSWPHQKLLGVKLDSNALPQVQISEVVPRESEYVVEFNNLFRDEHITYD